MTRVMLDAELRKRLLNCTTPLELCDESGNVLAKLAPCTRESESNDWIDLTPEVTDEEIQKEIESGEETYSTEELIAEMKKQRGM
jgi:hypothetical protein